MTEPAIMGVLLTWVASRLVAEGRTSGAGGFATWMPLEMPARESDRTSWQKRCPWPNAQSS